jgi:hypothetical protein
MADKAAPKRSFGLRPFDNVPAEPRDYWKLVNDEYATPYIKLLARQTAKLTRDGLKGINTINCWVSRWIQLFQHRDRLMHQYTGASDGIRCSGSEKTEEMVAKRICSLMKIPRKEKTLKFGLGMYENGS